MVWRQRAGSAEHTEHQCGAAALWMTVGTLHCCATAAGDCSSPAGVRATRWPTIVPDIEPMLSLVTKKVVHQLPAAGLRFWALLPCPGRRCPILHRPQRSSHVRRR